MGNSRENLKTIWFEGEMLPNWAQLLDAAARLCPVSEGTRGWFSRFTNSSGVDDARTVVAEVEILLKALGENKQAIITNLQRTRGDGQAPRIVAAWDYALETMIQQASSKQTCSWTVEGLARAILVAATLRCEESDLRAGGPCSAGLTNPLRRPGGLT